jgi:glyoxylase-like metal-dependent hydrolase (beta-lactamase superfamily II)
MNKGVNMQRRFFWGVVLAALATGSGTTPATGQRDFSNVEIRTTSLGGGVYMLMGSGGNIGLSVGEDGPFVVDDQFAGLTEKILAAVASVTDGSVRFVLNTHWHGDHVGGNENLGRAGAMIVAHENVRKRLNPEEFREVMGNTQQAPPDALPVVTFTDGVTFYWNGEKIRAFHVARAHTDGDAIIHYTNANVIHMGDTFFNGTYPFIDVNSGGNVDGMIHAAGAVLAIANSETQIIPGHGELATPDDLREYRAMLITVRDRIQALVNDGMSVEEIVAARPTADLDADWAPDGTFVPGDRMAELTARSLIER